jgi:ferredoxin-thioredoxin reductase catalytic subunit/glutaredoxin
LDDLARHGPSTDIFHGAPRVLLTKITFLYRVIETAFNSLQCKVKHSLQIKARIINMAEKSLIFYSLSTCGYCEITKKMLDDLHCEYDSVVVDLLPPDEKEKAVQDIIKFNPHCTFPTLIYGEKVIIGMKLQEIKDMLGVRTEVDDLYDTLRKIQEPKGYYFNRDKEKTFQLLRALLVNKDRYGYMSCPCRLATGDRGKDKDILCPCDYREPDVREFGSCYCNLYVSAAWNEGTIEHHLVPERRSAGHYP